jgi:hypothetical protein
MSTPEKPRPVKLIMSAIYSDRKAWLDMVPALEMEFGAIDYSSKEMTFGFTDYYGAEMGVELYRQFLSFEILVSPEELTRIKLFTNQLEDRVSVGQKRKVNLDPGYLSLDSLVLATGKPSPHRIYLRDGIWADLHMIYQSGSYQPFSWTYPDYKGQTLIELFNRLREVLKAGLKSEEHKK